MRKNGEIDAIEKLYGLQDIGFSIEKINEYWLRRRQLVLKNI
jgi:hypothetical protein